ncbi:diguanylate cyclase (GGDEF)-like protein/PAS domain S-box-containing protein [Kaistia hirudinis]|uniref:Diguanylate cyclase (GGDEF)-like protein/PAS domain S-box-containing protein n=1 Tax=Kaistia hirudinis TaxID=1293440 RepID=A0A840AYB3_9HYPH|nr:diguanylate cyclase [Kaistia hirudinis]MBB3933465.1 diguanylate cyclase (GGDEF)-like protein/PAS domain S-box-containing protein [Kaistia hirudinis]
MTTARDGASQNTTGAPFIRLDLLCRTARTLFDVPVVSICEARNGQSWIDSATDIDEAAWHFACALDNRPDATGGAFAVEDARADPATAALPFVVGAPGLRFMASLPLGGGSGRIALFDARTRRLTPAEMRAFEDLAALASEMLRLDRAARKAAACEAQFRLLAETSTDTIVRGNLDGVRLYISPAVRELLGYEPEEMIGKRAIDITHPDDIGPFRAMMQEVRAGRLTVGQTEQRQRHKDGSWVWLEGHVRLTRDPVTGEPDGYVSSVRGIGRRKAIEQRLAHIATHDELTGLPNRKLFGDRLIEEIAAWRSAGRTFSLLWMDIDRFKDINDGLGHQAGDVVLQEAARRFRATLRRDDMVARLGGDEFAVIQVSAGRAEAERLAARLIETMAQPIDLPGRALAVGLSIGIAWAPECGLDPDELLAAADRALYRAKSEGRRTWRCFEPEPARG